MKKATKTIFIIAIAGVLIYVYRAPLENMYSRLTAKYFSCARPIAYSIGSFDPKFGISKADFLKNIAHAESVWERPAGKEFFVYAPDGGLKINLIYDYRQEATTKLKKLGLVMGDDKASYDSLKLKYDAMNADYVRKKTEFNSRVAAFNARQSAYEKEVLYWNKRGGASRSEYDRLTAEKDSLDTEISEISGMQFDINAEAEDINALVSVLNRAAGELNLNVAKFNTIGKQTGSEFEEGNYQSGPEGQEIDIYQFDSQAKLVRVLAHELGHALGLEHLDNPKAIMYRLNQGTNEKLAADDLSAVKKRCGIK